MRVLRPLSIPVQCILKSTFEVREPERFDEKAHGPELPRASASVPYTSVGVTHGHPARTPVCISSKSVRNSRKPGGGMKAALLPNAPRHFVQTSSAARPGERSPACYMPVPPHAAVTSANTKPSRTTMSPSAQAIGRLKIGPAWTKVWNSPFSPQGSTPGGSSASRRSS